MTKSPIILSTILAASFIVLPTTSSFAAPFHICKVSSLEKRTCLQNGGKWSKLTCDCVTNSSNAVTTSISANPGTPGAGNPEDPQDPGAPAGGPEGGTEEAASGAGNPGNGKSVGNAGEKGMDNENPSSGTQGNGNSPDKGGKGKGKNKD